MRNPYDKNAEYSNTWQAGMYGASRNNDTVSHVKVNWMPVIVTLAVLAAAIYFILPYIQ